MTFNPSKSGYLSTTKANEKIFINEEEIPIVDDEKGYRYLGVDFTRKTKSSPTELFRGIVNDMKKIASSSLDPWQKLDAYKVFIHSRLIFSFRNYNIPNRELTKYGHADVKNKVFDYGLDIEIRRIIKPICGLQPTASNDYLYAGKEYGGLGLVETRDEYAIQSIIQAFRNLTCEDLKVAELTLINLNNTLKKTKKNKKN